MSTAGACVSKCTQVHEYYSSQSPKTRSLSTDRCLCSSASHMPPKRKGRAQPRLDVPKYKLLRQPMSLLGTQVKFPGSFWEGRMTAEEKADYLCTVLDFQIAHRSLAPRRHKPFSCRRWAPTAQDRWRGATSKAQSSGAVSGAIPRALLQNVSGRSG